MSTKLIIALVGFFLIGISIIIIIKSEKAKGNKVGIPLLILGVLMMIFGSYSSNMVQYNTQIEQISSGNSLSIEGEVNTVRIISPVAGDSVKCRILSMGVYPKGHTKDIWVVLRPTDNRYYPQSDHTNTSFKIDGEWQVVTRFGGDLGESYDLIVYETDTGASEFFSTTIEQWKVDDNYPGLKQDEIPNGANEVERITVYLSKNCRGVF